MIVGAAIKIPGPACGLKSHQICQSLPFELRPQQHTFFPWRKKLPGALIILEAVYCKAIPLAGDAHQLIKTGQVLAGGN